MVGDEQAAALRQQQVYQLLQERLGDWDRALAGQDVILRHLAQLGVTTWNKRPPTWTTGRRANRPFEALSALQVCVGRSRRALSR
jgi:hypothetical protein